MKVNRIDMPEMKLLLRDLELGPATRDDLAATLGIHRHSVNCYLKCAREAGLVRIVGWDNVRAHGGGTRVYGLKTSERQRDVPRPPGMSDAEEKRYWRSRRRSIGVEVRA